MAPKPPVPLNLAYAPSHPDTRGTAPVAGAMYGQQLVDYITRGARQRGIDPRAVLSVAPHEGGLSGAVGDGGTSFGPWQLHAGGALPAEVWARGSEFAKQWANSPAGIDYALDRMAGVIGHETGPQAAGDLVARFERPAAQYEPGEERAAEATYMGGSLPTGSAPSNAPPSRVNVLSRALVQQPVGQHVVAQKVSLLGNSLAAELLASASALTGGGSPNLANLFTLAKGFQTARKQLGKTPPLGGTALAQAAGKNVSL